MSIFGRLKDKIIYALQRVLGFENYLYVFSLFKIASLKGDKKEGDFFQFLDMIHPNDCVLDIGANIGVMTYFLSKKTPNGQVFSFEPVPENIATVKKIIKRYNLSNVNLIEKALGQEKGEIEMVMPHLGSARKQGLSHVIHESIDTFNEGTKYRVEVVPLDDVFLNVNCSPKAIKLDVENFEFFVLQGAEKIITKNRPIIYTELWDNENRTQCMTLLQDWNYSAKVVVDNVLVDFDRKVHTHQNFIFLP